MAGGISKETKAELLAALRRRYGGSSKKEKGRILDEFVAVSGYHRKHVIRLLSSRRSPGGSEPVGTQSAVGHGRRIYDEAVTEALIVLWEAADRICGKRLKAILPAMMRLLRDAGEGKFAKCVVVEMERLSRSTDMLDWLIIKKTFRENGIAIVTPGQEFDLADEEDDFLSDLFGALSKREKQKIVRRMKRGKVEASLRGQWVQAVTIPFGYDDDREAKRLVINEQQAAVVRRVFEWYAEGGMGFSKIAQRLKAMGIQTHRSGTNWSIPTVDRMLRNRLYVGEGRFKDVTVRVPPIVPQELYDRAYAQRATNLKRSPRNSKYVYLLTGLLTCAQCGSRFRGRGRPGGNGAYRYYNCWGKIAPLHQNKGCRARNWRVDDVEAAAWERVCEVIGDPGLASRLIAAQAAAAASSTQGAPEAVVDTKTRLATLDEEEARLWRAWRKQSPPMSEGQLEAQLAEVGDERAALTVLLQEQETAAAKHPSSPKAGRVGGAVVGTCAGAPGQPDSRGAAGPSAHDPGQRRHRRRRQHRVALRDTHR